MTSDIIYQQEDSLNAAEFKELLLESGIQKRPVEDLNKLAQMCTNSNLIITARKNGKLLGVARSLTDFVFCTYLSDLAVSKSFQKIGIGKKLVQETKSRTPDALLILLSAPEAIQYYPKIGLKKFENCYLLK